MNPVKSRQGSEPCQDQNLTQEIPGVIARDYRKSRHVTNTTKSITIRPPECYIIFIIIYRIYRFVAA
jgi:hypothetical protein